MHSPGNIQRLLRRYEAAAYITKTFGIPCSPKTLAKMAVVSDAGPVYRKAGPYPLYSTADLDAWASSRLGPPVRSTSQAREAA